MNDTLLDVWILTGAAIAANLFCLGYGVTAAWYRTDTGRSAWAMTFSVALLLDVALLAYWFHWVLPPWVGHVIYAVIFAACWMKFGTWLHRQILNRPRR